jgi:hypothetical protein
MKQEQRLCIICGEPVPQGKRGPKRETCSNGCRQARHRQKKGQFSWKHHHKIEKILKRRARPFIERTFDPNFHEPLRELSYRRYVYECMACGKTYVVDRIKSGAPASQFCSDACRQKTEYQWEKFEEAMARSHLYRTRIDARVYERFDYMKLSPLCPRCGKPFPPNTTIHGERRRGRPRKYCSDTCRKEAYEHRWKVRTKKARVHRFRECAECGKWFDRTDSIGRRQKKYCSHECSQHFGQRAYAARERAKKRGKTEFKFKSSGHGAAARGAKKNRKKPETGEPVTQEELASGGEGSAIETLKRVDQKDRKARGEAE